MKNAYRYYFLVIFFTTVVTVIVYHYIRQVDMSADVNMIARNIETPEKLVLNGYLGVLFGFKYSGNINWLILPLIAAYCIVSKNCLSIIKNAGGMVVVFCLTFLLISLKGYFNPRYQFTLVPMLIFLVFYFVWLLFNEILKNKKLLVFSVVYLFLLSFVNFYFEVLDVRFRRKYEEVFGKKTENVNVEKSMQYGKEVIRVKRLLDVIDTLKTDGFFLVNNLPDFYYYTHKKGHYYWCGNDEFYSANGIVPLFNKYSEEEIWKVLLNEMNCEYIYTYKEYNKYNFGFEKFLENKCKLICADNDDRMLYKILK